MMARVSRVAEHPVDVVHRIGAVLLGLGLWVFAGLGFADGLALFATEGAPILGLSSNGALSIVSVVAGAVLVGAAVWRGRTASTITAVMGGLFLVSGLAHLAIMHTELNVLAFRLPNVFFSLLAGMTLLFTGLYGRLSGGLPPDNPYRRDHPIRHDRPDPGQQLLTEPQDEHEQELLRAEMQVGEGTADTTQEQLVRGELIERRAEERRRAWQHARNIGYDS